MTPLFSLRTPSLRLDLVGADPTPTPPWPHAGEFLRWLHLRRADALAGPLPLDARPGV